MKKLVVFFAFIITTASFVACGILLNAKRLSQCSFVLSDVKNFSLASIKLDNISNIKQIGSADMLKILAALASKNINFSFDAIIKASNPHQKSVSLDRLDYIILLEENQLATGSLNEKFIIPAKSSDFVSVKVNINVLETIKKATIEDIFTLYQNIIGKNAQNTSLLSVKLKPTINQYTFPSYITIKKEI